jgi:hypothetical protein
LLMYDKLSAFTSKNGVMSCFTPIHFNLNCVSDKPGTFVLSVTHLVTNSLSVDHFATLSKFWILSIVLPFISNSGQLSRFVLTSQETLHLRYEPNGLMLSIGLWRWYINITITVLDIIHRHIFHLKLNSIGLSVPHREDIKSSLRAQQVNAIYTFVTMIY